MPEPISRRVLDSYLPQYYGAGESVSLGGVPIGQIAVCDLSGWYTLRLLAKSRSIRCWVGLRLPIRRLNRRW